MKTENAQSKKQEPQLKVRFLLAGIAVLTLLCLIFRPTGILDIWELEKTLENIVKENSKLREEVTLLKADVNDLQSNKHRIELEARKLGLAFPGEIVYLSAKNQMGRQANHK